MNSYNLYPENVLCPMSNMIFISRPKDSLIAPISRILFLFVFSHLDGMFLQRLMFIYMQHWSTMLLFEGTLAMATMKKY